MEKLKLEYDRKLRQRQIERNRRFIKQRQYVEGEIRKPISRKSRGRKRRVTSSKLESAKGPYSKDHPLSNDRIELLKRQDHEIQDRIANSKGNLRKNRKYVNNSFESKRSYTRQDNYSAQPSHKIYQNHHSQLSYRKPRDELLELPPIENRIRVYKGKKRRYGPKRRHRMLNKHEQRQEEIAKLRRVLQEKQLNRIVASVNPKDDDQRKS